MRPSGRGNSELRKVNFVRNFTKYAEGSVLVEFGDTRVLCNASVENKVPNFIKGKGQGWVTAEYSMLPRATNTRSMREVNRGKPSGRTMEIQRLIGRSLRAILDLEKLGENTIQVDCDVLQADGGTRTAAISGAFVALHDAVGNLIERELIVESPINKFVAAISVGIFNGLPIIDLDYREDSNCDTDMNLVMTESGEFIEIQGTAERNPFTSNQLSEMLKLAEVGIRDLIGIQKDTLRGS